MLLQEYKQLGFDTIELNVSSLEIPEETFLRFIRLVKSGGLKAKPHFQVKFNESDNSLCIYLHVSVYLSFKEELKHI